MNDDVVNALWKDTSKDVKEGWMSAAATVSPALETQVGNMYDTWLNAKVVAAQQWVVEATNTYIEYLDTLPSNTWCYNAVPADLGAYETAFDTSSQAANFNL